MSFGAGTNSIVGGSQGGTMTDPIETSPIAQPPNLNASGTPNANWNYANWAATNGYQGTPGNASGWATAQNTNSQTPNFYGNMSGYAPLPYQAFGAIPQITPQQIQPGDIGGFLPGYTSAVQQADQPMFQQQSDALNSDLASRGIYNSGAANASQGNLLAQQYATVLGQSLPYAQQDITGNVGAQNEALAANAAAYGNVTQGNQQQLQQLSRGAVRRQPAKRPEPAKRILQFVRPQSRAHRPGIGPSRAGVPEHVQPRSRGRGPTGRRARGTR